jgi:hypothetical protein
MSMIIGILCLLFLCSSVLILSSFPIYQYTKKHSIKKKAKNKVNDYYSHFFDVYIY